MAEGHIILAVSFTVVIELTSGVGHENGGTACDAIDGTHNLRSFELEHDGRTNSNIEFVGRAFLLRDQIVFVFRVPKKAFGNRLKASCCATAFVPHQHFHQMDHLMFKNALHGLQAIGAQNTSDSNGALQITESLKQKWC